VLYQQIAKLAALRKQHAALRRGRQVLRAQSRTPGLFAASRIDNAGREILVAFNTSTAPLVAQVEVGTNMKNVKSLIGQCAASVSAPGSLRVEIPALGYIACAGDAP
jgi:hypothetical protein